MMTNLPRPSSLKVQSQLALEVPVQLLWVLELRVDGQVFWLLPGRPCAVCRLVRGLDQRRRRRSADGCVGDAVRGDPALDALVVGQLARIVPMLTVAASAATTSRHRLPAAAGVPSAFVPTPAGGHAQCTSGNHTVLGNSLRATNDATQWASAGHSSFTFSSVSRVALPCRVFLS